jgi:hypothetical protein
MFARRRRLVSLLPALALAAGSCAPVEPDRSGDGGVAEWTVPQLRTPTDPAYPGVGSRVLLRNVVVTAVDTYDEDGQGRIGNIWVAEPAGGAWSGVQLFNPVVIPSRTHLVPGDIVEVTGTLDESAYMVGDTDSLTELSAASVQKTGETLPPDPTVIPETDLTDRGRAEPWEGCLVRIANVELTGPYDSYGETSTAGGVVVTNDLFEIPGAAAGVRYRSLTGIVTYFRPAAFLLGVMLMPRGPQDLEL